MPDKHLYDFGPFRLDLGERMLLRNGAYIPLTPKAFETLVVLIEHSGRIVDKGELTRLVWPDTFVEDVTLAKNVSTLRKVLGESEEHRYIDTIPKRGYRFVAEVRVSTAPAAQEVTGATAGGSAAAVAREPQITEPSTPAAQPGRGRSRAPWLIGAIAAVLVGVAVLWLAGSRSRPSPNGFSLKAIPLTSFPGRQNQVAFSPDGNQIAFVWDGAQGGTPHIYAKMIGTEALIQVTHGPGSDSRPAWSPDGRSISFLRSTPEGRAWYLTSALGGAERKIADVYPYFDLGTANRAYFSPDGKMLATVDKSAPAEPSSISTLSLEHFTRKRLTFPPAGTTGDYYPAFSPDGRKLAFARAVSFSATDLYVLALSGGSPKRLTFDGLTIDGLAWTPDSREIVFSSRRGGSVDSLWRIAADGGTPERISTVGEDVISPAISRSGDRLAYTRLLDDMNIWSFTLDDAKQVVSKAPLIASTFRDSDPDCGASRSTVAPTIRRRPAIRASGWWTRRAATPGA